MAIQERAGVTIVPARLPFIPHTLSFKQFSFHLVEIALRGPNVRWHARLPFSRRAMFPH